MANLHDYNNYFTTKMNSVLNTVLEHIHDGVPDDELLDAISALRYMDPRHLAADYGNELVDSVYLLKYGHAYAFEYAAAYDAILNREKDAKYHRQRYIKTIKPVTFGIGCGISTWSIGFAYAHKEEYSSRFEGFACPRSDIGVDLTRWPVSFVMDFEGSIMFDLNREDIVDYICNHWHGDINLLAFTKVLNELPRGVVDNIISAIEQKAREGCFDGNTYYLLLSHSKSEYDNDAYVQRIAQRLIDVINVNGDFDVDDTVPEYFSGNLHSNDPRSKMVPIINDETIRCYNFTSNERNEFKAIGYCYFYEPFKINGIIKDTTDRIQRYLRNNRPELEFRAIRTTSQICLQIIRLSRRQGGAV